MHISYQTVPIESDIMHGENRKSIVELRRLINKRVNDLNNEKQTIMNSCRQVIRFVHRNSLLPFNNTIFDYIELFIKEEKLKSTMNTHVNLMNKLNECLEQYKEVKKLIEGEQISESRETEVWEDVLNFNDSMEELANLPLSGSAIRLQVDFIKEKQQTIVNAKEIVFRPNIPGRYSAFIKEII